MNDFEIGETVNVHAPYHVKHGTKGTVAYYSEFMGTWGVEFDGKIYGFLPRELEKA